MRTHYICTQNVSQPPLGLVRALLLGMTMLLQNQNYSGLTPRAPRASMAMANSSRLQASQHRDEHIVRVSSGLRSSTEKLVSYAPGAARMLPSALAS